MKKIEWLKLKSKLVEKTAKKTDLKRDSDESKEIIRMPHSHRQRKYKKEMNRYVLYSNIFTNKV